MLAVAAYDFFFWLPAEEKAKLYSDDPAKKMRLSTSFNVRKETVCNWRDYLRLHCHPLEKYVPDWPANPPSFREIVSAYCREVRELGFRLYAAISASLGLEEEYVKKTLGEQERHMAVNFYPKCPAPELTYGLPAHTDPNALTVLLMDQQVAGLQVLKEGRWIAVREPTPQRPGHLHRGPAAGDTPRLSESFSEPSSSSVLATSVAEMFESSLPSCCRR
ncbi:Protein DOWNY MILDEW RESISTANCE 6 [Dichanthelium oligosanthes]|uniref:Protein DOWNY MILDEW RESISTANCE 6 n=1 Tax=Dichanthelium oligosanthes TaxID=888268 RepID=A0A1E5UV25_9POAL|nr:Protein DOWNY MILDEW RESISTANCE 6 [Dichanthelium oligosanthes]